MKIIIKISAFLILFLSLSSLMIRKEPKKYSLTVKVEHLRNSTGNLQFTLYNKSGSIPDEDFENYFRQGRMSISKNAATYTFKNLPIGKYAINILHDENKDNKIDKGWIMPIEGIGFSNFETIGFSNRPNFKKASFNLTNDTTKTVTIVYM